MRKGWIDYARGIAIILVVYKHVLLGFLAGGIVVSDYIYNAQEFFYDLRMPLFFIVSGLFITNSIQRRTKQEFFRYKFDTIFYPYLVWATLYLTIKILAGRYINFSMDPSAYIDVLIRPRTIDHFWYLYTLFVIIMLNAIYQWTVGVDKKVPLILLALAAYFFSFVVSEDYMALNDVLFYFLFMVIGILSSNFILSEKNREALSSLKLFFILLPFFVASQLYWLFYMRFDAPNVGSVGVVRLTELTGWARIWCIPMVAFGCLFLLNVASVLDKYNVARIIKVIGKHSLYIYIMHLMAIGAARVILMKTPLRDYADIFFVVIFIAGIIIPIGIYKLSMKMGMWFLYTPRKKSSEHA